MKNLIIKIGIILFFIPYISFSQNPEPNNDLENTSKSEAENVLISFDDNAIGPITTQKLEISGNMTNADVWKIPGGQDSVEVWCRGGFAKDSWVFADQSPDGMTALQMNRSKLIPNVWDGWMIAMFDFSSDYPLSADEMAKVKSGDRVIALDLFFEEIDSEHDFQALSNHEINDGDFGTKKFRGGIKFQLRLGKESDFAGGLNWFIAKEAYLTRNGKWQTLYFSEDEAGEPDLNYSISSNEVDRIWLIPNYSYRHGETNKFYFKNLRIVDRPVDITPPEFFDNYPKIEYIGSTWTRWSAQLDEPGKLYPMIKEAGADVPTVDDFSEENVVTIHRGALETAFNLEGLNPETNYVAYFFAEDTAGNKQGSITSISFTTKNADLPPPSFVENYPDAYSIQHNAFNIRYKIDKPGILYFLRVKESDPAPDMNDILNGGKRIIHDYNDENVLFFSGLKDNTTYHTYFVLEDFENPVNRTEEPIVLETKTKKVGEPHTPDIESHNPLIISTGGVYENLKINSTDYYTPAITISTSEPVVIRKCVISGSGDLIVAASQNSKITVEHNYIWGRNPDIIDQQQGRSVSVGDVDYFIFRNNYTNQTGGVRIAKISGNSDKSVVFEGNIHIDLTSLVSNGTGNPGRAGYDLSKDFGGALNRQMLILNNVNSPTGIPAPRIMYNLMVNNEYEEDNVSSTEDLINIFGSIGPSVDNPILVGRNFLRGAHGNEPFNPYRPFTGTGIVMDASNASGADFGNIEIFENFISYAQNSGIGISSGHHIKVFGNKIVNPLIGENGEQISGFYGNGMYVWAWKADRPVSYTEVFENNIHNYKSKEEAPGSSLGRNDWWFPDCFDTNQCYDNNKLSGPLNHDEVLNMYCEFYQVLLQNDIMLGPEWGPGIELVDFDFDGCEISSDLSKRTTIDSEIVIWPNPTKDILYVNVHNDILNSYVVMDVAGRSVLNGNLKNPVSQSEIITTNLSSGVYIFHGYSNSREYRKVFVKQ